MFTIYALEGQVMQGIVRAGMQNPTLEFNDPDGNLVYSPEARRPFWRGVLPVTGEYQLKIEVGSQTTDYELFILILPPGVSTFATTHRDEEHGFSLDYSDYFAVGPTRTVSGILETPGVFTLLFVGSEYYEGTNLREAELTVNVSRDPSLVSRCLEAAPYEQEIDEVVLNGIPFQASWYGEGAAGSLYDLQIYRTTHKGTCYHIFFRIRSTNIGVFGPDTTIQEFDQESVASMLMGVLSTFRFIP